MKKSSFFIKVVVVALISLEYQNFLFSQTFYFNRFNGNCSIEKIILNDPLCNKTVLVPIMCQADIAFHPNGTLYSCGSQNPADTYYGHLFTVDTLSGAITLVGDFPNNHEVNSLVCRKDGIIFAAYDYLLSYNPTTNIFTTHGLLPKKSGGDLTFRNGKLYLIADDNSIFEVNIEQPEISARVVNRDWRTGSLFGMTTVQVSCDSFVTYASGVEGKIFIVDFTNGVFIPTCNTGVWCSGATSPSEFYIPPPILPISRSDTLQLCEGQNYSFHNRLLTKDTFVCDTFKTAFGCDSLRCKKLTFIPAKTSQRDTAVCFGQRILVKNKIYAAS